MSTKETAKTASPILSFDDRFKNWETERDEMAADLKAKFKSLTDELNETERRYKKLTGKSLRPETNGAPAETGGTKAPSIRIMILTELAGEEVLAGPQISDRILAKYPSTNPRSIAQTLSQSASNELIERVDNGYKITP